MALEETSGAGGGTLSRGGGRVLKVFLTRVFRVGFLGRQQVWVRRGIQALRALPLLMLCPVWVPCPAFVLVHSRVALTPQAQPADAAKAGMEPAAKEAKLKEPSSYMVSNPTRVVPAQVKQIALPSGSR